jgi:hypothetical protein
MPVDSVALASASVSGHAYRQESGVYTYTEGATSMSPYGGNACNNESITTVSGGTMVSVTPQMPAAAVGQVAFLYQLVKYEFKASSTITGRTGLWRTLETSGVTEELAAPFDASARFRFYRIDEDTARTVVPTLTEIRGLELSLLGSSEQTRFGRTSPETAKMQTAVFFMNRLN